MKRNKIFFYALGWILLVVLLASFPYLRAHFAYQFLGQADQSGGNSSATSIPPAIAEKTDPNMLFIPSLNIKTPIVYVTESEEQVFQNALQGGVVHFPGTALPGKPGNTYIFGHSSDFLWAKGDYKTVFALLPKIEIGQYIEVSDPEGNNFIYKVTETRVVGPKDVEYLDQGNFEKKILTVQTSYPLGTAFKRFLVIAELVE